MEQEPELTCCASILNVGAPLFFIAVVLFLIIASSRSIALRLTNAMFRILPGNLGRRVGHLVETFLDGLAVLRSPADVLLVFVMSLVIWMFEAGMYYMIMLGFGFRQPFYVLMLATAAANLFTIAPSTPGYVGVFDFPVRATLTAFGVAESLAISYTLVLHAALWLPVTLLGLYYLWREGLTLGWLQKRSTGSGSDTSADGVDAKVGHQDMKIGIIGAGIAGLTAAYELGKAGHAVTVFEKDALAGGLASGFKDERWQWPLERFYHHLFQSDSEILDLAKEVGAEVIFRRPITAMWSKGEAYPFDSPLAVLEFPHLGLIDKMRTGLVVLYLRMTKNWLPLEKYTSHEWLCKYMGERAYTTLWEPLLVGKFGELLQGCQHGVVLGAHPQAQPFAWLLHRRLPGLRRRAVRVSGQHRRRHQARRRCAGHRVDSDGRAASFSIRRRGV